MAPLILDRGFTADVHSYMTTARNRPTPRRAVVLLAMGISFIAALAVLPSIGEKETNDSTSSIDTSQGLTYEFRVHALNCSFQTRAWNGTILRFNSADLPFEFSTILFGDYRTDATYTHRYYSGSGILLNATGTNAVMTLRENGGRFVSRIDYHGQPQVVFNGKFESVTYPNNTTVYEGTDQMIQDWRNGTWTPDTGVFVEHPSNVTLTGAKFYIMTIEPFGTTDIPEFDLIPVIGAVAVITGMLRWRFARR